MTTDEHAQPEPSRRAEALFALQPDVIAEWMVLVRAGVAGASKLRDPILVNTMPALYDNLVQMICPEFKRTDAVASSTLAIEHGSERARMTRYGPEQLIQEYHFFRTAFFGVMQRHHAALSHEEAQEIHSAIDTAVMEAISSYTLAHAKFRQDYVATLAHDLRTPLNTVSMASELISRGVGDAENRALAAKIKVNADRADEMIRELLDVAALHSSEMLPLQLVDFDMLAVVQEVVDEAAFAAPRCDILGESVHGTWCRRSLKRSIENLLGNAIKYGAEDGRIQLKVMPVYGRVAVSVHNDGRAIPPDQISDLFEMFKRSSQTGVPGWGLGLPFVRKVAESHGGSVVIDSAPERGTTVTIDIPVDTRPFVTPA